MMSPHELASSLAPWIVVAALLSGCGAELHYDLEEVTSATPLLIAPPLPVSLSPDRSRLLLFTRTASSALLQVMGLESQQIVAEYAFDRPQPLPVPTWSPDGTRIVFVAVIDGAYELRVWNLESGEIVVPKALLSKNIHGQGWDGSGDRILHFVHPVDDPRGWRDGARALYWVDPTSVEEPELFIRELGQSYHKALAGDGRLAVVYPSSARGTNILTIHAEDGAILQVLPLDPTSEIGQVGWTGPESIRMSVRREGDEFYGIEEVDLLDGTVLRIADDEWDLSAAGYLWDRTALRHVMNVDGLRRTRICTIPVENDCWWIGPEGVGSGILTIFAEGDSAHILLSGPMEPPSVHVVDLRTGASNPVYVPEPPIRMPDQGGVALYVVSEDGFRIPAYHWRAERIPGREPAALIHIPGGPGLQGVPVWEPYIPYLVSRGIDVVYMNYRGQTGYGASYEKASGEIEGRARELLAVRRHLIEEYGIPEERVILYGHSYGAPIVMVAAAQEKLMTPLLLASATSMGNARVEPYERCVVAFHGDTDIIVEASTARESYLHLFGRRSLREPCGHFEILPGEGHVYETATSYARVFAAAVAMLKSPP